MFDQTDQEWATAQRLYQRCAYEAMAALRENAEAEEIAKWVNMANAIADIWTGSDGMPVLTPAE